MKNSPWQPENKQARQSSSSVQIVQYSALAPENYDWIWPGWIARRKIHILSGPYEARNIAVAINIASILSNVNSRWPDKSKQSAGNVLIWSGGGDEIDMIVPLLKAAKCDMNHVHRLNFNNKYSRSVTSDINEDSLFFDQCIEEFGDIDLIIINPLINADASGSNKKLKALIIRLSEICSKHRCAILGIIPEKTSMHGKKAINRTTSYLANDPSIPMVMITAKVEVESETNNEQLNQYVLVRGKNLFSLDGGGLLYEIKPVEIENDNLNSRELINTWAVEWNEGMIDGNPDSILKNAENGQTFDLASKLNNAELFLRGVLSQGALFQSDIYNIAEQNEISTSSLRRASDNLAIIKQKQMGVQYGKWVWYLQGTPENEIFSHNKPSSQSLLPKKSFLNLNNLRTEKYVDAVARPEAKLLSTSVSNERAEALNQNKSPFPVSISNSIKDADLDDNKEKGKIAIVASKNASHPLSEVGGSGSSFENIDNIRSINFESLANKETQFNANQIDMTDEQMEIQQHNDDLDRAEAESKVDPVEVDKEEEQREIQEHNDDLARAEAESKIDQTDIDKEEEQKDIQQHYDDLDRAEAESKVDPVEVDKDDEQSEIQQHNDDLARAEAESKVDPVEVDKDDEQSEIQQHNDDLARAEAESKVDPVEVDKDDE
nr:AAA family ATPase [Paludibacter sp.]